MIKILKLLYYLGTFASNPSGQLYIFRHDSDTLGMDSAQVGVFKQTHEIRLTRLLINNTQNLLVDYTNLHSVIL